ncbi:MAG: triose-phosphate isomerase, partial [Synergistaceae bacterium]|nr:triose-phosphate isomerase [Synergistaceae bacterium]
GRSATADQAQEVCAWSKELIAKAAGAAAPVVLYGGSVKGANAKELLSMSAIDGALVGGASLDPKQFMEIWAGYRG